jgi:hypothetical protein
MGRVRPVQFQGGICRDWPVRSSPFDQTPPSPTYDLALVCLLDLLGFFYGGPQQPSSIAAAPLETADRPQNRRLCSYSGCGGAFHPVVDEIASAFAAVRRPCLG